MASIIGSRDNIFTMPVAEIQAKLWGQNESDLSAFYEYLLNPDWLHQHSEDKLIDLTIKVICVSPPDPSNEKIMVIFLKEMVALNLVPVELQTSDRERYYNELYEHNPQLFKRLMLRDYEYLTTGGMPRPPSCPEEEHLCWLEVAIDHKLIKLRDILLENPPLDHKTPRDYDLFTIVSVNGTIDDIEKVLDIYLEKRGSDALKVYLKDRGWEIGKFIYDKDVETFKKLIKILHERSLNLADFMCEEGSLLSVLAFCPKGEMYEMCLQEVPLERFPKSLLNTQGGEFLFSILSRHSGELGKLLSSFERIGAPLSKIFRYRNEQGLSVLDQVCLNHGEEDLKSLLKHLDDEDKRELLFTRNYGGRRPLEHSEYYNFSGKSKCPDLIRAEMKRL